MEHLYVACHLSPVSGQVAMGSLGKAQLTLTEIARFAIGPVEEEGSLLWDVPQIYQELQQGLKAVGSYDEPVHSISCTSWGSDYMLFSPDGTLLTPTYHFADSRGQESIQKVNAQIPWETIYAETGMQQMPSHTLFQVAAEKSRRLKNASCLLSVADGFNYLLSGIAKTELSQASTTQLFNPVKKEWSSVLREGVHLPAHLLPELIPAGTVLGPLRPELTSLPGFEEARVTASCSHETAAALAVLPEAENQVWAFLRAGTWTLMGMAVPQPIVTDDARDLSFSNGLGYNGTVFLQKQAIGLWMLNECRRFWEQKGCGLDDEMLTHLAGSAPPFESLINPGDPRFLEPGDMPMKIQAFCKETYQPVPRKPGAIIRCVLESLAFLYRKLMRELQEVSGMEITRLYILGGASNRLLHHFTANALQMPVTVVPSQAAAIGNVLIQALALGQVKSLEEARALASTCADFEVLQPHASACAAAYDRLEQLLPCPAP